MSTVTKEEASEMSPAQKWDYHEWCWYKDYGNCDYCALKGVKKPIGPKIEEPEEVGG